MSEKRSDGTRIMSEIRRRFRQRGHRGTGYRVPEELRGLVLSAMRSGQTISRVAAVAGISETVIRNWSRSEKSTPAQAAPVELKLIDGPREGGEEIRRVRSHNPVPMARIILRSGAAIEIPVSALDDRLLVALNGGTP